MRFRGNHAETDRFAHFCEGNSAGAFQRTNDLPFGLKDSMNVI